MQKLFIMKSGATKPLGWIKEKMDYDLKSGFVGHLNKLVPELFEKDDIYGTNRRGKKITPLYLGLAEDEGIELDQLQWWNSETQSQWYDGYIRHAFLLKDKDSILSCNEFIEKILKTSDDDGYIGIYTPETRYKEKIESGELWSQTTLFRALISYYELTGNIDVINAVIKAVDLTIKEYKYQKNYLFNYEQSHGLMISDILDYLYKYTGDKKYLDYLIYLYDEYNNSSVPIGIDAKLEHIQDENYRLWCHGVHTYEHLRMLTSLASMSNNELYIDLLKKYESKVNRCICPSGGGIGDEWIHGFDADATRNGYEYCSLQELLHSYMFLLEWTGDLSYADKIENIFINAAQGARNPEESGIAYLKSDNSYSMEGGFHIERDDISHKAQVRYKYSPTHQEAAVCCVPNAGRIAPYYLQAMWYRTENGFIKALYGASTFETEYKGVNITIKEKSSFPANGELEYEVNLTEAIKFELSFRIPVWCKKYYVISDKEYTIHDNAIIFDCYWDTINKIKIVFEFEFEQKFINNEVYFSYGPVLLAMPLKARKYISKGYPLPNFYDVCYALDEKIPNNLFVTYTTLSTFKLELVNDNWFDIKAKARLWFSDSSSLKELEFCAFGNTVLRKLTFDKF